MLSKMLNRVKNRKGFSLVELIVVIAIMAILIAILAPQFLKYVEKSRESKDLANKEEILRVVAAALADVDTYNSVKDDLATGITVTYPVAGTVTCDNATLQTIIQGSFASAVPPMSSTRHVNMGPYTIEAKVTGGVLTLTEKNKAPTT